MLGNTRLGFEPIAGWLGIKQPAQTLQLDQDVVFHETQPAVTLGLDQQVRGKAPAIRLLTLQQRVLAAGTSPTDEENWPAAAYVELGGSLYPCVENSEVNSTHAEDQGSSAAFTILPPKGEVLNIPALQGQTAVVTTHADPRDASSPLVTMFTGRVSTAAPVREKYAVNLQLSDLRDERLAQEQDLETLLDGPFSPAVQNPDATGLALVQERMRTVSGSIGYTRDGTLNFYEWGTTGKPLALNLTGWDVERAGFTPQFQDRKSIVNAFNIEATYRYMRLNSFTAGIEARRDRIINTNTSAGFVASQDTQTFASDSMVDRANSFQPWETIDYSVISASQLGTGTRVINGQSVQGTVETTGTLEGRAVGFRATLQRRIAQPVTLTQKYKIVAQASIDGYQSEAEGGKQTASIQVDFSREKWEEGDQTSGANGKTAELQQAVNACYYIGRKEILASHRRNYISFQIGDIVPLELGQIVAITSKTVTATGQIVNLEYAIRNGRRRVTSVRIACFFYPGAEVDHDAGTPPDASFVAKGGAARTWNVQGGYADGVLTAEAPEIADYYTEEIKDEETRSGSVIIENKPLILVNR